MINKIIFEALSNEAKIKLKTNKFKKIIKKEIDKLKNKDKNLIYLDFKNIYYIYEDELDNIWEDEEQFLKDIYNLKLYQLCKLPGKYKENIEYHEPNYWGRDTLGKCVLSITYQLPACKEFIALNSYITNILKCKPLNDNDVYVQRVEGKRSSIFGRGKKFLLIHNPEKCKEFKKLLQTTKKPNWKAELKIKHDTYWGDRFNSYGEDMEMEWNGHEYGYAEVNFKTPSGKIMNTINISLVSIMSNKRRFW